MACIDDAASGTWDSCPASAHIHRTPSIDADRPRLRFSYSSGSLLSSNRNPLVTMMHALDALGNPVRRAILQELRGGPRAVGEIAATLPVSRPAVSRHLRLLEEAGLVEAREEGTRNLYAVRMSGFASVREVVDAFWDT